MPSLEAKRLEALYALEILEFKALGTAIDPEGILILERTCARKDAVSGIWKITRSRKYGKTEVIFCVQARKNHPNSRSDELVAD